MANVMILGAHGQIATLARHQLLKETDHHLSLSLRNAGAAARRQSATGDGD